MSIIELENPTKLTELDCDTKTEDTLETVLSITKAEEIISEFKRAIEEVQDHQYGYFLLILGEPFSIRLIIQPDKIGDDKIAEIAHRKLSKDLLEKETKPEKLGDISRQIFAQQHTDDIPTFEVK